LIAGRSLAIGVDLSEVLVVLERQRLDKWLWHARVVKARTQAAVLVERGHVRINGAREKSPGHAVKIGDVLTVSLDRGVRVFKVTGFAERRGDAAIARTLYEDMAGNTAKSDLPGPS
jgi:ribosome-associated heat shock protein Hsp15